MKKITPFIFLVLASFLGAEKPLPRSERSASRLIGKNEVSSLNKVDILTVVPHLAVAENEWSSALLIRNDQNTAINLFLDFVAADGLPATVEFLDSDNNVIETDTFDLQMAPFEIYTLEFLRFKLPDTENDLRSIQVFIFADESESNFSLEALLHNFQGEADKVATVGVDIQVPGLNFFMNIDRREDLDTQNAKLRGLAITNTDAIGCDCNLIIFDQFSNTVVETNLANSIDPQGKVLGTTDSFFEGIDLDTLLPGGLGVLDVSCTSPVSVVGLAFEPGTPIVGSVPIDYYEIVEGKRVSRRDQ